MISRPNRNDFRRMGLYFRENYKQGEPVDVSIDDQEWNGSWIKWYESRLEKYSPSDQPDDYSGEEFDNTEVSGAIIPPDPPDRSKSENPPRIRLREKGKNAGSDNLHPGHLEFKVFLQKGVEDGLSGRSSPRILHRKEGEIVRDKQESMQTEKTLVNWLAKVIFHPQGTSNKKRRITSIPDFLICQLDSLNGIRRGSKARKYAGFHFPFTDLLEDGEKVAHTLEQPIVNLELLQISENDIFLRIARETARALISISSDSFFDDDPKEAFIRWEKEHGEDKIRKFAKDQEVGDGGELDDVIRRLKRSADRVMPLARVEFGEIEEMEIFCSGHKLVRSLGERISRALVDETGEALETEDASGNKPFSKIRSKGETYRFPSEFREYLVHPSESGNYEGARKKLLEYKKKNFAKLLRTGFGKGAKGRSPDENTEVNSRRLAYNIVNIMLEEGILEIGTMSERDILQNLFNNDKSKFEKRERRPTKQTKLVFTGLLEKVPKSGYRNFRPLDKKERPDKNAIFRTLRGSRRRWMYCPPEKHKKLHPDAETKGTLRGKLEEAGARRSTYSNRKARKSQLISLASAGGLLLHENRTLVSNHNDYSELGTPRCEVSDAAIDALNHLQEVQWEINLDFLEALCEIELYDQDYHKFISWDKKKSTIGKITEKDVFREAFKANDRLKADERKTSLEWSRRIIDHNANVFWHSWNCDFRGRMYPTCSQLSPEGDDFDRAMIRFKHWKELGVGGKKWLFIHTYNLIAGVSYEGLTEVSKEDDFERRHDWVEENRDRLREMARLLKNSSGNQDERSEVLRSLGLHEHSSGKSPRFQRLAALLEFDRVCTEYEGGEFAGDWSKITSGQPIHLDGSCNGYQHVSCLLRDRDLAEKVNVTIGGGNPQDLYKIVADKAKDAKSEELYRIFTEDLELDPAMAKTAIKRVFSRNVAKAPTMTKVYGAKDFMKGLHGKGGDGDPLLKKVPKIEEDRDEEELSEGQIPEPIKRAYQDLLDYKKEGGLEIVRYFEGDVKKALENELKQLCKRKDLEDKWGLKKGSLQEHVQKALQENRRIPVWAEGSSLYNALIEPGDVISKAFRGGQFNSDIKQPRIEYKITRLVNKALIVAIRDATNNAYGNIEDAFKAISKKYAEEKKETEGRSKGKVLHKNSIRWELEDGFIVRNYYAYRKGTTENNKDRPTKRSNSYGDANSLLPEWYRDQMGPYCGTRFKSTARTLYRCLSQAKPPDEVIEEVQHLHDKPETAKLWAKIHDGGGPRDKESQIANFIKSARRKDHLIEIYLDMGWLDETEKARIASVRLHRDYDHHDFDKHEGGRITDRAVAKVQSSLPPNFVHSLDSLHMRNTINTFFGGQEGGKLGFWAVHDSFGTHACDIDRMREIIRDGFKGIHKDRSLLERIRPIAESADLELGEMALRYQCQNSEALATLHNIPDGCSHTQNTQEDPKPCNKCTEEYIEIHPDYKDANKGKFRSNLPDYEHKGKGKTKKTVYKSLGFLDTKGVGFDQALGEASLDVEEIASSEFLIS